VTTQPIWFLPLATREEAAQILHDKDIGNFIIRESKQARNYALSVKLGSSHGFVVHHYIIEVDDEKIGLEDSELYFSSIISLAHHYSTTNADLPCLLSLPAILQSAVSTQYLLSLALLGQAFWSYPMARPGQRSIHSTSHHMADLSQSCSYDANNVNEIVPKSRAANQQLAKEREDSSCQVLRVLATPPRYPRRSLQINASSPSKEQRMSDCKIFSQEVRKNTRFQRHSVAEVNMQGDYTQIIMGKSDRDIRAQSWISSPIFPQGKESNKRARKQSVFCNKYADEQQLSSFTSLEDKENAKVIEQEIPEKMKDDHTNDVFNKNYTLPHSEESKESENVVPVLNTSKAIIDTNNEEPDYAEPLDSLSNTNTSSITVGVTKRSWNSNENIGGKSALNLRKQRYSDSHLQYEQRRKPSDVGILAKKEAPLKKQSLPIFFKKLSEKTETVLLANEQKFSKQERRLSSLMDNFMSPSNKSKRVSGASYQIDSSSWEFLNKEHQGSSEREGHIDSASESEAESSNKDSLYQSEFDSTSTIETKLNSLPKKDHDNSVSCMPEYQIYSEEVRIPKAIPSLLSCNSEIEQCIEDLVERGETFFSLSVREFITCTLESKQSDIRIMMRNMRQFMTGMKNYLIRTGEEDLKKVIEKERTKLRKNSFIDIDSVLEHALQNVITKPLYQKLLTLFNTTINTGECCDAAKETISCKLSEEFQYRLTDVLYLCKESYSKLENSLKTNMKVSHYLDIVRAIINQLNNAGCSSVDIPTFCSSLVFILGHIGAETVEHQAEIMWGLAHRDILQGEIGFYLALLHSSASIRNTQGENTEKNQTHMMRSHNTFLPVMFLNERSSSLTQHIVPLIPAATVRDVRNIIGCKYSCRDTHGYGLYSFKDGQETKLNDCDLVSSIAEDEDGHVIIYRGNDTRILLPLL